MLSENRVLTETMKLSSGYFETSGWREWFRTNLKSRLFSKPGCLLLEVFDRPRKNKGSTQNQSSRRLSSHSPILPPHIEHTGAPKKCCSEPSPACAGGKDDVAELNPSDHVTFCCWYSMTIWHMSLCCSDINLFMTLSTEASLQSPFEKPGRWEESNKLIRGWQLMPTGARFWNPQLLQVHETW